MADSVSDDTRERGSPGPPEDLPACPPNPGATASSREPLESLAEEYLECVRRGERPQLSEFTDRHPELTDEIRDLFPTLMLLEQVGSDEDDDHDPLEGKITADGHSLERLGDYRIIREIGRGGMGIVYEAEQEALGRHVALKVLPFHAVLAGSQLQRFQREARAAARLHHTNIVPVFGVGEFQGVHYYAMQFIQGRGLDQVLTELAKLRGGTRDLSAAGPPPSANEAGSQCADLCVRDPSSDSGTMPGANQLTSLSSSYGDYYRSVARIGLQVAEGLAHAHGQGVLHRDIKPSNLLLDAHGTVWVTDFGLAKADAAGDLTHTGDIVGTLRYMAPERFQGWSDPRSDIYSLGLTLYELVALRPAFDESNRSRLIKRITQDAPPSPRRFAARIPHDLETIVLKAITHEPGGRYQSGSAMADDLRRFLTDRPIDARRASWPEQFWRWCRRNPVVAGMCAALLLVFALGFAVSLWQWQRAEANLKEVARQSGRAAANLTEAERQRTLAESNLAEAEWQADRAEKGYQLTRRTVDGLFGTFSADSLLAGSVPLPLRRQLLELAIEHHRGLVELSGDDPDSQAELASSYLRIAAIHKSTGASVQAVEACEKAADLLTRATRKHPDDAHPDDAKLLALLAQIHKNLGQYRQAIGRISQAQKDFDTTIEIWTKLLIRQPDDPNYLNGLASSYNNVSYTLSRLGKIPESIGYTERSLEIRERLVQMYPENREFKFFLAVSMSNLAQRKVDAALFDQAIEMRGRCSKLRQELLEADPNSIDLQNDLAASYNRLGDTYRQHHELPDQLDRAMNAYQQALEMQERLVHENPGLVPCRLELANTYCNLATVHRTKREYQQALNRVDLAMGILEEPMRQTPEAVDIREAVATALCLKGAVLGLLERREEGIEQLLRGVEEYRVVLRQAPEAPEYRVGLCRGLADLADLYRKSGHFRRAAEVAMERTTLWTTRPDMLFAIALDLATTASAIADDQSSRDLELATERSRIADQSLEVLRDAFAAGWKDFSGLRRDAAQGGGLTPFRAVWEFGTYDQLPTELAFAFGMRAAKHLNNRDYASAIVDYSRHVEIEPKDADSHHRLARLYAGGPAELRNPEKALHSAEQALAVTPGNTSHHATLGAAYYRTGRYQESIASLDRARELNKNQATTFELLYRAMCLNQLRQRDAARQALDQAIRSLDAPSPPTGMFPDEFQFLREEAEEKLSSH